MTTVLIDNYDSFTWNIYQYLSQLGTNVIVFRNDKTALSEITQLHPTHLVISPGPGHPSSDAGISKDVIRHFEGKIPILGVCLGMQCAYELYGGEVTYAGEIVHGKTSILTHDGQGIFSGLPNHFPVIRYHSLAGKASTLPEDLMVTSLTDSHIIQGIRHKSYTIEGVQFHPESILTDYGKKLLHNFISLRRGTWKENQIQVEPRFTKAFLLKPAGEPKHTSSILQKIYNQRIKDIQLAQAQPTKSIQQFQKLIDSNVVPPVIDFRKRLEDSKLKIAVIGEIKRASPSAGDINPTAIAREYALIYAQAGAAAISVLTEPTWFKGSLEDMMEARYIIEQLPNRPAILRKDFIFDKYQVLESRVYGADSILLIVAMLSDLQLVQLLELSRQCQMEPLVEVSNLDELSRAVQCGASIIGINNRDLHTFTVDTQRTTQLASLVPKECLLVALSGIKSHKEASLFHQAGARAVLVGQSLMEAQDKLAFIQSLQ